MKLFTLAHKDTFKQKGWDILQVGKGPNFSFYRDNTSDNISEFNHLYLETTGIYWIWKNVYADIVGQQQMRRRLNINVLHIPYILEKADIICATPYVFPYSIENQYFMCHMAEDILQLKDIIGEEDYNKYIRDNNILFYSNSFICKKELYDKICRYCFGVLDEFVKKNNFLDYDTLYNHAKKCLNKNNPHKEISEIDYQMRICGALFERLFTVYVLKNNLKIYNSGKYIFFNQ